MKRNIYCYCTPIEPPHPSCCSPHHSSFSYLFFYNIKYINILALQIHFRRFQLYIFIYFNFDDITKIFKS